MACIMVTDMCNLHCPYCFASEFTDSPKGEISNDNFKKAVDFILRDGTEKKIGLIGGEPTLHSDFENIMHSLILDSRVDSVYIFTNGLNLKQYLDVFVHEKVYVLINCNSPQLLGDKAYRRLEKGIEAIFLAGAPISRVGLGINIYEGEQDYNYMLDLLTKYNLDSVRVSVTVPCEKICSGNERFRYFANYRQKTVWFCRELFDRGIVPQFDCNKIPFCFLEDEERFINNKYFEDKKKWQSVLKSNYFNRLDRCLPSVVIGQDLSAIRCFGLSGQSRRSIEDFTGIGQLIEYYKDVFDSVGYISDHKKCDYCTLRIKQKCMGGCLVFKEHFQVEKK